MFAKFFKLIKDVQNIKPRVSVPLGFFAIFCALVVDLIQILLDILLIGIALNPVLDMGIFFSIWLFFRLKGVNLLKPTRLIANLVTVGTKVILGTFGLDLVPLWTVDVIIYLGTSWAEDIAAQTVGSLAAEIPGGSSLVNAAKKTGALPENTVVQRPEEKTEPPQEEGVENSVKTPPPRYSPNRPQLNDIRPTPRTA